MVEDIELETNGYDFKFNEQPGGITKVIEGIGKDVKTVVNTKGGKQSYSPFAFHLLDPEFLKDFFTDDKFIERITLYMRSREKYYLRQAIIEISQENSYVLDGIFEIAKVLKEGAEKYQTNNWRLVPAEQHVNHAITHYLAHKAGDTQDSHLTHCICRLMMAYATEESQGFDYTKPMV